jgi:hypothetical protein
MCDVCFGCELDIAAIDSEDSRRGCFLDSKVVKLETTSGHAAIYVPAAQGSHVARFGLLERGWVFQELRLAPRILYRGRYQFFWLCQSKSRSEDGCIDQEKGRGLTPVHNLRLSRNGDRFQNEEPQFLWAIMAQIYSQLALTYRKDRIVALLVFRNGFSSSTQ